MADKKILSFDPGVTTGWAYLSFDEDDLSLVESGQIKDGLNGFLEWWAEWWESHQGLSYSDVILVCESFILREGVRGVNLEPCYVIGALRAITGTQPINYQPPSHKVFCDNDVLKNLGMWLKGQDHARDAVRHAIAYLRNAERHKPTLKRGWPDE